MSSMQVQIQEALGVKPVIDVEQEIADRIAFIQQYLYYASASTLVLGISGGQDSSLCGRLCQLAVEGLRAQGKTPYMFIALRLPYGKQVDEEDAQRALTFIRPDKSYVVNIRPAVEAAAKSFEEATGEMMSDFNRGNQKAQERMAVQYRFATGYKGIVVGTDHAAEAVTGFFTKYGDGGVDITPLSGLTKRQGRELLKFLGADSAIYMKAPTADLLDAIPGQLDETELGLTYEQIDNYLEGQSVDASVAAKIEQRYIITEHKRHLPVTPFDSWWKK